MTSRSRPLISPYVKKRILTQVGDEYLRFTQKQFRKNSSGGGSWATLSPHTVARKARPKRGKKKGGNPSAILVETGKLRSALLKGAPGNRFKVQKNSVKVGYSGQRHKPSGLKYNELADIHANGKGNSPKRPILEMPDGPTKKRMQQIVAREIIRDLEARIIL